MTAIRWGIVGAGNIAHTFARDMKFAAGAELVAVAARRLPDARSFAERYDIDRAHEGYDRLFTDPEVDAVYVATPHNFHLPNAAAALRAGKAVLCEKPLTISERECRELLAVARQTGGYLMEAMWTWFLPAVRTAKSWFDAGRIGALCHIRADFGYPKEFDPGSRLFDPALAGGCLLDMGIYPIALARLFTNADPDAVQAVARYSRTGVEDDVVMTLDYPDCVAALATSFRCKLPNTAFIVGTEGSIEIPHFWAARDCRLVVMDETVDSFNDGRRGSGFEFQVEAVSMDLREGRRESAVVTHRASTGFQRDMDRVRRQLESAEK